MIIASKIGENEPEEYQRYNKLSHHGDIIYVSKVDIPSLGTQGDRHYYVINVDVSSLSEEQLDALAQELYGYYVSITDISWLTPEKIMLIGQQEYIKCNIAPNVDEYVKQYEQANHVAPLQTAVSEYEDSLEKSFDMRPFNDFVTARSLDDFAAIAFSKETGRPLTEWLLSL